MFNTGTHLYIHNAGVGAVGCNGCTGIVVNSNEHIVTNGLLNHEKGFLIKLDKNDNIWKVHNEGSSNAHYEILEEKLNIKKEINNIKTLQIPVKYQNGDTIYTIRQTKLEINCHICEGTGRIKYNDKDMRCPECMGAGKFKSDKNIYVVCDEKFIISLTKINVDNNGDFTVRYKGRCGFSNTMNRAEENLFLTKEEAQLKCDDLNKDKIYIKVDDIIIQNSFKETKPGIDKIQAKLEYFKENNKFEKNIVVDRSKVLLDGYVNYLICKMLNIETIRVVVE